MLESFTQGDGSLSRPYGGTGLGLAIVYGLTKLMQMPPLNDIYAATHAREAGLDILFCDAEIEPDRFQALVRSGYDGVDAVVILSSTQSFRADTQFLDTVKAVRPQAKGILFGAHPTFMPGTTP